MPVYSDLELLDYYLVKESETDEIKMLQVLMETSKCVMICNHSDFDATYWKMKNDVLAEIIDKLSDEEVAEFISISENDDMEDYMPSLGEWEDYEEDEEEEEEDEN